MGKFIAWLAGKSAAPKPEELRRDLRLLERRMERYERNLESKRKKAIKSLERALKRGDMDIAKEYAKHAVMLERDLKSIIKLRGKITNLLNLVERGLIMDKIRESIQDMIPIIYAISNSMVNKDLQSEFAELLKSLEQLEVGQEMLTDNIAEMLNEGEVDEDAEKLLREKMIEQGIVVEEEKKKTRERKVTKEEIEKLLREVEKDEIN